MSISFTVNLSARPTPSSTLRVPYRSVTDWLFAYLFPLFESRQDVVRRKHSQFDSVSAPLQDEPAAFSSASQRLVVNAQLA